MVSTGGCEATTPGTRQNYVPSTRAGFLQSRADALRLGMSSLALDLGNLACSCKRRVRGVCRAFEPAPPGECLPPLSPVRVSAMAVLHLPRRVSPLPAAMSPWLSFVRLEAHPLGPHSLNHLIPGFTLLFSPETSSYVSAHQCALTLPKPLSACARSFSFAVRVSSTCAWQAFISDLFHFVLDVTYKNQTRALLRQLTFLPSPPRPPFPPKDGFSSRAVS
ncbi:hypothetical protein C8Q77DRAFT_642460 [Trametes polyzona]|nr:hypothetical protein C8Q77DRAFT_642460 [Trametes polyzona]